MIDREAEVRFRRGLRHLECGRPREALPLFASAVEIQQKIDGSGFTQATYRSYLGLCQCLGGSEMYRGLRECRRASKSDPTHPAIWFNLGRAALLLQRRGEAHRAFQRGLQIQPGHPGIARALKKMGVRRRPTLGFLPRESFVNVWLGRTRSYLGAQLSSTGRAAGRRVSLRQPKKQGPSGQVEELDPVTRSA